MRKINYILIDSDCKSHNGQHDHHCMPDGRHHYCVNRDGLVINNLDICKTTNLIEGPHYDRDKFNRCAIGIAYHGSLRPEAWLTDPTWNGAQRKALLNLLAVLRKRFPEAKILGVSEIDGKAPHYRNIIVNDAMNVIRKELSDLNPVLGGHGDFLRQRIERMKRML